MERDIVVGVDGTDDCDAALTWAAGEAARSGVRLVVVHVWEPRAGLAPYAPPRSGGGDGERARTVLERAVRRVRAERPEVEVAGRLVRGRPEVALRQAARGAALLVLGSAAHRAGDGRLGAVLLACLRWPPCPVTVVGAGQSAARLPVAAAAAASR